MSEVPELESARRFWNECDVWEKLLLILTRSPIAQRVLAVEPNQLNSPSSLSEFLQELRAIVHSVAQHFAPDPSHSLDEIAQESLTNLWKRLLEPILYYEPPNSGLKRWSTLEEVPLPHSLRFDPNKDALRQYIRAVIRNTTFDLGRRRKRTTHATTTLSEEPVDHPNSNFPPSTNPERSLRETFEETLDELISQARANGNSLKISEDERELLWLRYAGDDGFKEIMEKFDIAYSTAAQRLRRIRMRIQSALGNAESDSQIE